MQEYYFLFALAFIWVVFATIQDLKKREVDNWLTYSLVLFALAYRAFYASLHHDLSFFMFGLIGFVIFLALANLFYYGGVFAGGDAKLLMGIGIVIPFESYTSLFFNSLGFFFLLFSIGAIYSILFSIWLAYKNPKPFKINFFNELKKTKYSFLFIFLIAAAILIFLGVSKLSLLSAFFIILVPFLYIYLKAIESGCMIKLVPPMKLSEGDWLEKEIKIKGHLIKKSVHGLSWNDIKLIKKSGKSVWIKEGVPFIHVFLIAFLAMVFFFLILKIQAEEIFLSLL